jgi:hypothetical protein
VVVNGWQWSVVAGNYRKVNLTSGSFGNPARILARIIVLAAVLQSRQRLILWSLHRQRVITV